MSGLLPGTYVCIRNAGLVPWIIRSATHSPVDHTFVVVDDGMIVEAEPGDVRLRPLSQYAGRFAVADVGEKVTAAQRSKIVAKAMSLIGADYNFLAIGADGAAILGLHWELLLRLAGAGHCFDCSQLAAVCGQAAGLDWSCGMPSLAAVTPADLAARPGMQQVTLP